MKKEIYLEKAVKWAETKAPSSLKSILEGYQNPIIYTSKTTHEEYQADFSFVTRAGVLHSYILALKDENPKQTAAKCKVLSFMVSMKKGQLHLLAPNGHKSFAQKLVKDNHIDAIIDSI